MRPANKTMPIIRGLDSIGGILAHTDHMSGSQKFLYWLSLIILAFGACYVAIGVVGLIMGTYSPLLTSTALVGAGSDPAAEAASLQYDPAAYSAMVAVVLIIYGIWQVVISLLGVRGAKNPRKMLPITLFYLIDAVLTCVMQVQVFATEGVRIGAIQSVVPIITFFACLRIVVQNKKATETSIQTSSPTTNQ